MPERAQQQRAEPSPRAGERAAAMLAGPRHATLTQLAAMLNGGAPPGQEHTVAQTVASPAGGAGVYRNLRKAPPAVGPSPLQRKRLDALLNGATEPDDIIAALGRLLVIKRPDDEAEAEEYDDALVEAAAFWHKDPDADIPAGADGRVKLVSMLMAADARRRLVALISYLLGIGAKPAPVNPGIGTLAVGEAGVSGRPGLFAVETGAPTHARRHIVAWHSLRDVMNVIIARWGPGGLAELSDELVDVGPPRLKDTAEAIAEKQAEKGSHAFKIIRLAVILNNIPSNLWSGAAKENISINTLVGYLSDWMAQLDAGRMRVSELRVKLVSYRAGAPKARRAIEKLVAQLDEDVEEYGADARRTIYEYFQRSIRPELEVDTQGGREMTPNQLFLFEMGARLIRPKVADIRKNLAEFIASGGKKVGDDDAADSL